MSNIEKTALSSLLDDLPVALNAALGAGIGGYGLSRYNKLVATGASELAEHNKKLEQLNKLKSSTRAPLKTKEILDYEDALNRFNSGLTNRQPGETFRTRQYYDDLARYNEVQSRAIDGPAKSIAASIAESTGPTGHAIMSSLAPSLAAGAIGGQEAMLASLLAPRVMQGTNLSTQMLSAAAAGHLGDVGLSHLSPGIQQSIGSSPGMFKNLADNLFSGYTDNAQTIANSLATDKNKVMTFLNPSRAFDELSDVPRYLAAGMAGKYLNRRTAPTITDAAVQTGSGLASDIAQYIPGLGLYSKYSPKLVQQAKKVKSYIDKKRYVRNEMKEIEKLLAESSEKTSSYRKHRVKSAFMAKLWNSNLGRTAAGAGLGGLIGAATANPGDRMSSGLTYAAGGAALAGGLKPLINSGFANRAKTYVQQAPGNVKNYAQQVPGNVQNRYTQGKVQGGFFDTIKNFVTGKKVVTPGQQVTTTPGFNYLENKLTSHAGTGGLGLDAATAGTVQTKLQNQSADEIARAMASYGHNPMAWTLGGAAGAGAIGAATAGDDESALLKGLGYATGGALLGRGAGAASQYLQRAAMKGSARMQAASAGAGTTVDDIMQNRYQQKILENNDFAGREVHKQLKTLTTPEARAAGANLASARAGNVNFNANTGYLDDSGNFVVGIGSNSSAPAEIAQNMASRVGAYNPQQFQNTLNASINAADQGAVNALMSRAAAGDATAQKSLNMMGAHMHDLAEIQRSSYSDIASQISNTLSSNVKGLKVDPNDLMNSPEFQQYVELATSKPDDAKNLLQTMVKNLGGASAGTVSANTIDNAIGAAVSTTASGAKNLNSAIQNKSQQLTKHINESSKSALNYNISSGIDDANSALQTLRSSNPQQADEITARLNAAVSELASTGQRGKADELLKEVNARLANNKPDEAITYLQTNLSGKANPYSNTTSSAMVSSLANSGKNEFNAALSTMKGRISDEAHTVLQNLGSVSDRTRQAALLGDAATLTSAPLAELERLAGAVDPKIAINSFNKSIKGVNDPSVLATIATKTGLRPSATVSADATNLLNMARQNPQEFSNYMKTLSRSRDPESKFLHILVSEQLATHQKNIAGKVLRNKSLSEFRSGKMDITPDFASTSKVDAGNLLGDISSTTQAPVQNTLQAPVVSTQSAIAPTAAPTTANYGSAVKKGLIGAAIAGTGYGAYNMLSPTAAPVFSTQPAQP